MGLRRQLTALALGLGLVPAAAWADVEVKPILQVTTEERYDDDVLLRTESGAGEFITKVSPQLGLDLKRPSWSFEGWYAADLLYAAESGQTDVDHRARLDIKDKTSERNTVSVDGQLWRVTDPTSLPRIGVAVEPWPILYGTATLTDAYWLTRRLQLETGYHFEGAQVYQPDRPAAFLNQPHATLWYSLDERTSVGAEYRFQEFQFGGEVDHANSPAAAFKYRLTRETTFEAKAGPVFWAENNTGQTGLIPRGMVDLERTAGPLETAIEAGHDLVGASGFTAVLWADFASAVISYKLWGPLHRLRLFGGAAYFRNGYATNAAPWELGPVAGSAQGYSAYGGAEWRVNPMFAVQGAANRIAQIGGAVNGEADMTRDIVAFRLVITPL
jgi:hypothetical protein